MALRDAFKRFMPKGTVIASTTGEIVACNNVTASEWLSATPVRIGKQRRNKAIAKMKREQRKKNR